MQSRVWVCLAEIALRAVLIPVLVFTTICSLIVASVIAWGVSEGLSGHERRPASVLASWLSFLLVVAAFLATGAVVVVVFDPDPSHHRRSLLVLWLLPFLFLMTIAGIILAGAWELFTGHPTAYGGRPRRRLETVSWLVLVESLFLLPPVTAWLLLSLD